MKKLLCAVITVSLILSAVLSGCSSDSSDVSSGTPDAIEATDTTVKTTGEKIKINDSSLGEIWITELEGVAVNKLDNNGFTADDKLKYYSQNGKPASTEGIDVSSYSGDIDWQAVKNYGIDFVMVRIGGRGYGSDGNMYADERAAEYLKDAKSAGLKVGGYFFSQAINTEEAIAEAEYADEIIGDIKLDYPLAYDWEIIKDDDARTDNVTAAEATACAKAFCSRAKQLGYKPMIYSPSRELYFKYDLTQLADYDIWYCEYSDTPNFYYEFSMWQYSCTATVDGIEANVDLNICFTDVADYD